MTPLAIRWRALALGWNLPAVLLLLVTVSAIAWLPPTLVPLPQVFADSPIRAPISMVAALAAAVIMLAAAGEPVSSLPRTSVVSLPLWRTLRMLVLTIVAAGCCILPARAFAASTLMCLLTLTGEGLLTAAFLGLRHAWMIPMVHLFAAVTVGGHVDGSIAIWAWVLRSHVTPGMGVVSVGLYLLGLRLWATRPDTLGER